MNDVAAPAEKSGAELRVLLVVWLVVCAAKVAVAMPDLVDRTFPDPDDAMRLLQVRDWLAGQSWFDVSQHRLNVPFGGPMHWSRLIDLPIAAVILLFRPFVGQYNAETAALIIVPMLTLGAAMLLVQRITARLANPRAALLAVVATPAALGAMTQMRAMRIDHHGWQIVLSLAATLAALDRSPRRSGLLAGLAIGTWLNVSIEGLPFGVAIAALFAFQWLSDSSATQRLKTYLVSLAVTTASLFALTHLPSTWLVIHADALNAGHIAALTTAALACQFAVQTRLTQLRYRLAALAFAGLLSAAAIFAVNPNFLQPFGLLDPLVQKLWYAAVDEGNPIWRLTFKDAAAALAQPVVGLAGAAFAIRKCEPAQRPLWVAYTLLLCAGTVAAVAVTREATLASLLALPGTAFVAEYFLVRARAVGLMPKRVLATFGALCIMAPAYAVPAVAMPHNPADDTQPDFGAECARQSEIAHLNVLPVSTLAAPLDITPAILADTRHRAIGSGHHRNVQGIRDMILLFVGGPAAQRDVISRRHIDYVVFCPGTAEAGWWSGNGPKGLAAMLSKGKAPDWLERVHIPGMRHMQVWRVLKIPPGDARG